MSDIPLSSKQSSLREWTLQILRSWKALAEREMDTRVLNVDWAATFKQALELMPQDETAVALGPRTPDNDMVICPNCTCQFVAIPVNAQSRLQPFIGDVRRALFNGEATHDMWVRDITAAMELKGFIESTSQHAERRAVKSTVTLCPTCKTELAFEGDVCGLCNPVAPP